MNKLFCVSAAAYAPSYDFEVYHPASLDCPSDHSVMFINEKNVGRIDRISEVKNCIIFHPDTLELPESVKKTNLMIPSKDPRTAYCLFFRENHISNAPQKEKMQCIDGAWIAETAVIGENAVILPLAYIGGEVTLGNNVYIGAGAKLVGKVRVGNNVVIRENSVIGADGLSTDRDEEGKAATMPQFGGVRIGDDVQIGALTVIARGAIDDTVIGRGCKIDNSCFISHNVQLGEDTFVVGETIMFGGSKTGRQSFISGNSTIRNKASIGDYATVGMGAVVTKNVEDHAVVFGNPAHAKG
ncbi:MAG: hypothetical protein IJG45_01930 [Oscillospiraceae bacterium]|nr:hypothetical protein [Oscillospiraceae bacterium]